MEKSELEVTSKTNLSSLSNSESLLNDLSSLTEDIASADSSIKELRVWHAKRRMSRVGLQPLVSAPTSVVPNERDENVSTNNETALSQFGRSETHAARLRDIRYAIPQEASSSPVIALKELASADAVIAANDLRRETIQLNAKLLMIQKLAALGLDDNEQFESEAHTE